METRKVSLRSLQLKENVGPENADLRYGTYNMNIQELCGAHREKNTRNLSAQKQLRKHVGYDLAALVWNNWRDGVAYALHRF